MEIKILETSKYVLYREKRENRDKLIMKDKTTGKRLFIDTEAFIKNAENCISEVKKYD